LWFVTLPFYANPDATARVDEDTTDAMCELLSKVTTENFRIYLLANRLIKIGQGSQHIFNISLQNSYCTFIYLTPAYDRCSYLLKIQKRHKNRHFKTLELDREF
jgi:hypothetical protein